MHMSEPSLDTAPELAIILPAFNEAAGITDTLALDENSGGEMGIPTSCNTAENAASAVGCEFYGLDLNNLADGENQQFGFIGASL